MSITFVCKCGKKLKAGDKYAGTEAVCPACGKALTVPSLPPTMNGQVSNIEQLLDGENSAESHNSGLPARPKVALQSHQDRISSLSKSSRAGTSSNVEDGKSLFCKPAVLAAVIGGIVFITWGLVSTQISFSAFSQANTTLLHDNEPIVVNLMVFFFMGLLPGFVLYHLWQSPCREMLLLWTLAIGGVGAILGCVIGAMIPLEASYHLLHAGRALRVVELTVCFAVYGASCAVIFASSKRRTIRKAFFFPVALTITLLVCLLTFVPIGVGPQLARQVVAQSAGHNAVIPLIVGIVVACVRWFKGSTPANDSHSLPKKVVRRGSIRCPKCSTTVSVVRVPTSLRQALWGGWTCRNCGCEINRRGEKID